MNGILVVDKPPDFTSFDVVAKMRGICGTRKMGHGGTLDPMATGVLPIFIGPAVKAVDLQPWQDKRYVAEFLFGIETDSGDITGEVVARGSDEVQEELLHEVLASFEGEGRQVPPMVSAVKVKGRPLYQYAREGMEVERQARPVTIHSARCTGRVAPGRFLVEVHCSKGTYIRVLAQEVGRALGTHATLAALRRTGAGVFGIEDAHTLDAIQAAKDQSPETLEALLTPLERLFEDLPVLDVAAAGEKRLCNGAAVYGMRAAPGRYRLQGPSGFLGLGCIEDQSLTAEKLFIER